MHVGLSISFCWFFLGIFGCVCVFAHAHCACYLIKVIQTDWFSVTYSTQTCFAVLSVLLHVKPLVFFGMCILLTGPSCITTFAHVRSCAVAYTRGLPRHTSLTERKTINMAWLGRQVSGSCCLIVQCFYRTRHSICRENNSSGH